MKKTFDFRSALQLAGAFIAGMIGSGFATGQEVLQFFSSFGLKSYLVLAVCMVGFLLVGHGILRAGQQNKSDPSFQSFLFFCKKPLGIFYLVLTPIFLLIILAVMIAGAGATIYEYFGISRYIGSAVIAALALISYLIGFKKLLRIVSMIGPLIIVFLLTVGVLTIIRGLPQVETAAQFFPVLASSQTSPWWLLSAVSYMSMNFIVGVQYYAELGIRAPGQKEAAFASIVGALVLILSIAITNSAILVSAQNAAQFDIPILFMAKKLAPAVGLLFCIFLVLGIFSSCATTMWTICHQLAGKNRKASKIIAVFVAAGTYAVSFVPFSRLMAVLYPIIGYISIPFVLCIIFYEVKSLIKKPSV